MKPGIVEVVNESGASPFVLICEHASNYLPPAYARLGLPETELQRHIAWDIGAARVSRLISSSLNATLFLSNYSRLLIDLNRPLTCSTSIPEISEATPIPGNMNLLGAERQHRADTYFIPFHHRIAQFLDQRIAAGHRPVVIAIHSFTPTFLGQGRPWKAGVLYRKSRNLAQYIIDALGGDATGIAHNEPYKIDDQSDYAIPIHGEARGLEAVLVELRQDLISEESGGREWAAKLCNGMQKYQAAECISD